MMSGKWFRVFLLTWRQMTSEAQGRTSLFSDMEGVDFEDINDVDNRSTKTLEKFRAGINPIMNRAMKARGIARYTIKRQAK